MKREPKDFGRGVKLYEKFTTFEPRKVGTMPIAIPETIGYAGDGIFVTYRSDKWHKGERENYIHEHDNGVRVYRPDIRTPRVKVPSNIQSVKTLTLLGVCLGIAYRDADGEEVLGLERGGAELYATPDGKALIIVSNKNHLAAMIWGGKLSVQARGIVG